MNRRTCLVLIASVLLVSPPAPSRADTACITPAQLAHASVRIIHYFDAGDPAPEAGVAGIQGSGWFLSPTTLVTVAHVATAMNLPTQDWKPMEIRDGNETRSIPARISRLVGHGAEKLAVIELQTAAPAARILELRQAPLAPDEDVVAPAYPDGRLRFVSGRFDRYSDDGERAGAALLEMYDGNNRLAIDHGASGAPVIDCHGRVAAVVDSVVTQTLAIAGREVRVSTAWGMPNVVSVPIQALQDTSQAR
jgi:hypothetical protein